MDIAPPDFSLERFLSCRYRLVVLANDGRRLPFQARLVTVSARLLLFAVTPALPESEAPGGCLVEISFADEDGLHSFSTRAVALSARGGLWIQRPDSLHTLQRRAHFRVRSKVRGKAIVTRPDHSTGSFAFETQDLSAGGMRFDSSFPVSADDDVAVELAIPELGKIATRVRLVRCTEVGAEAYALGTYFERLSGGDESRIVRFLNHEQIRLRRETASAASYGPGVVSASVPPRRAPEVARRALGPAPRSLRP